MSPPGTGKAGASASIPGGPSEHGSSCLATVLRCGRKWTLTYGLGYRIKYPPAYLVHGSLYHAVCAYWHGAKVSKPPDWLATPLGAALDEIGAGYPEQIRAAKDFAKFYPSFDAPRGCEPVMVEQEFGATLAEIAGREQAGDVADERVTCRADLVCRINGRTWLLDHKTVEPRGEHLQSWNDARAFATWGFLAMHNFRLVSLFVEDLAGFLVQRIKRSQPFEIDVNPLLIPVGAMQDYPRIMIEAVRRERQILAELKLEAGTERRLASAPNFTACDGRYGLCEYVAVCQTPRIEDRALILAAEFNQFPPVGEG